MQYRNKNLGVVLVSALLLLVSMTLIAVTVSYRSTMGELIAANQRDALNAMTIADSTKARPQKPYPEYPLFAHNNGQWCRKIRGKIYSFGKWSDPTAALKKHNAEYSYLKEGISPPDNFDGWRK